MKHTPFAIAFFVLLTIAVLAPSTSLAAGPVTERTHIDRVNFGAVRLGATVEGSVKISQDGNETAGVAFDVQPPPFVKIKKVELGTKTYGSQGTKVLIYITMSIKTDQVGHFVGPLTVEVGSQKATIPIEVDVLPRYPSAATVLIAQTPFDMFAGIDSSHFKPWIQLVQSTRIDPHYLEIVRGQPVLRDLTLSKFDVILLGTSGLLFLQDSDISRLKQFVKDGGRLIISADNFYRGTVPKANELLAMAGLQMTGTELQSFEALTLDASDIVQDPLTQEVQTVRWFRPSPIAVTDKSKGRVLVSAPQYPEQGFVAAGKHGKGTVIAIGDSLWWAWIGVEPFYKDSDNQQLMINFLTRHASEK